MTSEERNWGMLCHLTALSMLVGIPLGNILGPLIIWLIKKEQYPFVDDQGKEALNFQISMLIYILISAVLIIILVGIVLLPIVIILDIVYTVIAAISASNGQAYRYPMSIRFVK